MFRLAALSLSLFFALALTAGCASTGSTSSGANEYSASLDQMMGLLDLALQDAGVQIEDSAQPDDHTYVLVVRQINASARAGATNSNPQLQSLHVTVRSVAPSRTSVSIAVPTSSYGATGGAQLRQRLLRAINQRAGRS